MTKAAARQGPSEETHRGARAWRAGVAIALLAICLLAPSAWMFATVPPLWRDVDAYVQLTESPPISTRFGHAPLYPVAVRAPLYIGYILERIARRIPASQEGFFHHPHLTDTGILLLLASQHVALSGAALFLILTAAAQFSIRLVLCLFFASNPLFYAFAHCVGSESLSIICVLAFAGVALRILRSKTEPRWSSWFSFAVVFYAAVLTRHANVLLLLVLPCSFLLCAAVSPARRPLMPALLALVIGLASIGMARHSTGALCRSAGLSYYSRIGFTFLWRLSFAQAVPEPDRSAMLDQIAERAKSEDARRLIGTFRGLLQDKAPVDAAALSQSFRETLFPRGRHKARRVDEALNTMAIAFLLPPTEPHWRAAHADFLRALRTPLADVSGFLFWTTTYYFTHPELMPQAATLSTFRNYTPEALHQIRSKTAYFRFWRRTTLTHALIGFAVAIIALLMQSGRRRHELLVGASFAAGCVLTGAVMIALTCLIGQLLPRYTLPLWVLLWIALIVCAGTATSRQSSETSAAVRMNVSQRHRLARRSAIS